MSEKTPEMFETGRAAGFGKVTEADTERYFYDQLRGLAVYLVPVVKDFVHLRKTRRLAPGILRRLVDYWLSTDRYGRRQFTDCDILEAARTWVEQGYGREGKDERYFNGILRNVAKGRWARKRRTRY